MRVIRFLGRNDWLAIPVGLALVAAVIAAGALIHININFNVDTDDPDTWAVHMENDLGQPVVVALCQTDHSRMCTSPSYTDHIKVGGASDYNIGPDAAEEWAIKDKSGQLLRCVRLYWKHYPGGDVRLRLSKAPRWAWPCPRSTPTFGIDPDGAAEEAYDNAD